MNKLCRGGLALAFLAMSGVTQSAVTALGSYGNVFPTVTEANITLFESGDAPWYVTFNLVETANVKIGAIALPSVQSGGFVLSAIRIVTGDGNSVPGVASTDSFTNPFADPIERLSFKDLLAPGLYALEINGSGNSVVNGCGRVCDGLDFTVRLQVTPVTAVPEFASAATLLAGLVAMGCMLYRSRRAG